jgi:AcrR family transcriptional regulator
MARPPARPAGAKSTREQILDVALELFTTEGFENTSLREIAERMGFSKAALYYHFASKDDILLALHLRLHELGRVSVDRIDRDRIGPEDWVRMLDGFIDALLENRKLFLLHMRNRAALEKIAHTHDDANHDIEERFRRLLTDARVPRARRLRLSFAVGSVAMGIVASGEMFKDVSTEELRAELRSVVRDLLGPAPTAEPCAEPDTVDQRPVSA